ncbi:MAG TPA: ElyC/SanA/YdcF family protein [Edaphocola sp.]|nr:ElyC/SanA/YdcF family protein [Edaphocola sp.]
MKLKKILRIGIWSVLLFLAIGMGIVGYMEQITRPLIYRQVEKVPNKYVAIVFGAGIQRNGLPSKYLKDRLDAGIRLYNSKKVQRILLSGDNGTKYYNELKVMKKYMVDAGVSANDIFVDYAGFDTYSSIYRAKNIFKVDQAVLVTQAYHLRRAVYIADKMGMDVVGFSADKGTYKNTKRNLIREQLAKIKSFFDVLRNRKPKFYTGEINIYGSSNYDIK